MGYSLDLRSKHACKTSEFKWNARLNRESLSHQQTHLPKLEKQTNLCKYQLKTMVKYINMQISLCPNCSEPRRCSKEHLNIYHKMNIADIYDISDSIHRLIKQNKINKTQKQKQNKQARIKRTEIIGFVNSIVQPNFDALKKFLNSSHQKNSKA